MRYSIAAAALVGAASAVAMPQAPAQAAAAECQASYPGTFQIQVVNTTSTKRDIIKRAALELTLNDGILKDAQGRIGYIAANRQFQFDNPVQTGTIYDKGWAACSNGTLVLGSDAVFQQCLSGTFYNLYDEATSEQCSPVNIYIVGGSGSAAQSPDGQVTATPVASPVSQIGDGQVQGSTGAVSQIGDGQIQAPTGAVSQIGDGQIQAPTGAVSQIGDGQIQAPTGAVSQISDGQIQAPTGAVSQIADGQIQAPTGAPVTQIGDGQIQAPTGRPVSQISDGQIQAPTNSSSPTVASPTVQPYTGAAAGVMRAELFGLAAGVLAVAML